MRVIKRDIYKFSMIYTLHWPTNAGLPAQTVVLSNDDKLTME